MKHKYKMAGKMGVEYGLSIALIVCATIYMAVFSGLCQKLTAGCVPNDSGIGQIGFAGIGITIGMMIAIVFTFMKPVLCSWPRGTGTILLMLIISGLLITSAATTMSIINKKFNSDGKPVDPSAKIASMQMNSVLFLSMGVGVIYAILMNMMSLSIGRKPIVILGSTLIPIAIYSIAIGSIVLSTFNKNKDPAKHVCAKYEEDMSTDLSGIANIVGNNKNPPYGTVMGMTIGSGIFLVLISTTLYFTKGKM
jgi:hypothetical protein